MDIARYLERIQFTGDLSPTAETLRELQLSHLLNIPFENLSIHLNEPISLPPDNLYEKIIIKKRGGFCYELNSLFAALLSRLGYTVTLLSAGVANASGGFGREFDHMALLVSLHEQWLVDVGFGDSFREPLRIVIDEIQVQGKQAYRFEANERLLLLKEKDFENNWKPHYRFSLTPRKPEEFLDMCAFHQSSPESIFTRRRICSMAKPDGRVTLSDMRFIETTGYERREHLVSSDLEYRMILQDIFGIIL
jgi:N-hydroxyarylamine O-acetyltransferase